jgi:SAM-dependent methyltransferase
MNESTVPFYSHPSLHVEIYDTQTTQEWQSRQEDAGFYVEEAKTANGPVLELGCGTGRLIVPLLATGLVVHGLDASAAMLRVAEQKRASLQQEAAGRLHLHVGNMVRFDLEERFALIYIAFRSFQILSTRQEQKQCLLCCRKHLAAGGRLIINLFDPRYDLILPGRQPGMIGPREFTHPVSGNRVRVEMLERVNDPLTQTFEECWRFTETDSSGGILRQEEESLRLRWTFRYEMQHLVESCGFAVEAEYSDFHRAPPAYGKEQVWVLRAA